MFFDNASTTIIDSEVLNNLQDFNDEMYFNPGALYRSGRRVKEYILSCKNHIKNRLGCERGSLYFCASATECNNLALFGCVKKNMGKILISQGEHPSVYNVGLELKNQGYSVEFIPLDSEGRVGIDAFRKLMTKDVGFVSIMHVSNETGAINDIRELCEYAKRVNDKVVFHCDGVQAFGKIDVDVYDLGVDMYTISSHKIHGPKGIGALYVSSKIKLKPIIYGGGQEDGLRSGTENTLAIRMFEIATRIAYDNLSKNFSYVSGLKDLFLQRLASSSLDYVLHSGGENSPYIISISFVGCRAETLLNMLDDLGCMIGNGSACSAKNSGNRILESMGVSKKEIESNVRISFSKYNTTDEVIQLCDNIIDCVSKYIKVVGK